MKPVPNALGYYKMERIKLATEHFLCKLLYVREEGLRDIAKELGEEYIFSSEKFHITITEYIVSKRKKIQREWVDRLLSIEDQYFSEKLKKSIIPSFDDVIKEIDLADSEALDQASAYYGWYSDF